MGGGIGPPMEELMRGTPGKGGGPSAAIFTCRAETVQVLKYFGMTDKSTNSRRAEPPRKPMSGTCQ